MASRRGRDIMKSAEELLKACVYIIDDWDLVNGESPDEDSKVLLNTLVEAAITVGIDPNELKSLKTMLGNNYKIILRDKP